MKKIVFKIFFYLFAGVFLALVFGLTVINTMGKLIKGEEIKTPNFVNLSLQEARQFAFENNLKLEELPLNSAYAKPEIVISQYPQAGRLIKKAGNRVIKIYYTPKKSEIIMPDLSGMNISQIKKILSQKKLKWYFSFIQSDTAPADYIITQTYLPKTKVKKGNRVGILISMGRRDTAYVMPEIIGKKADIVLGFLEDKGIKVSDISYTTYEGIESGIIINQEPRSGYKITNKSIVKIEVSE